MDGDRPAGARRATLPRALKLGLMLYAWGLALALGLRLVAGDRLPPVVLFSQLMHLLLLPAPLLVPLAWRCGSRTNLIALGLCSLGLFWSWSSWLPGEHDDRPRPRSLVVLTWNLGYGLADVAEVVETIRRLQPDFAALQEVQAWQAEILFEELDALFPYHERFEGGLFSKAYLSRSEPLSVEMAYPAGAPNYLAVTIAFDEAPLVITSVHTSKSLSYRGSEWWGYDQLVGLADAVGERGSGLFVGDLNTTERTRAYARISTAGLHDAFRESGSGPGFTFPAFGRYHGIPLPPITRIDYLWHTADLECHRAEVTPSARSDHRGVLAVFSRRTSPHRR